MRSTASETTEDNITCIGIGPGDLGLLTRRGAALIAEADVVAGFTTVVNFARELITPGSVVVTMEYRDQTERLEDVAAMLREGKRCVVLFMGDIHFSGFQYLARVEAAVGHPVSTLPGISSSQVLASKAKVCFDETTFITFHRRGDIEPFKHHLLHALQDGRNAIVIPLPWSFMPAEIAAWLVEQGLLVTHRVEVWENLTGDEASWSGTLADCTAEFSHFSIMLIRALTPFPVGI
jgi:precorrin-6y C5,15-methyltransferase (decarboxylating) CbiE subunit